jgi:hypothetical protein
MESQVMRIKGTGFLAAALAATALLAGCASTPTVRFDYDRSADFGKYRTFGFLDHGDQAKSLAVVTLETAATREMQARGYTLADNPDLLVNFTGKLEDRTDVQSTPGPAYGVGYGYGGWHGAPYGGWGYQQQVTTRHYKVGNIILDIVDREKRQVVFQSGIEKTVTKEMMERREEALNAAATRLFSAYPFVAGQSAPVTPPPAK